MSAAPLTAALLVLAATAPIGRPRRAVLRRLRRREESAAGKRSLLGALGRVLSAGRAAPEDEALVGIAPFAAAGAAIVFGLVGVPMAVAAILAALVLRRRARRRERILLIERALPEVIDLLSLVVGAGRPTIAALSDVWPRVPEPFRSELAGVARRIAAGEPFADSVRRLAHRLGPAVAAVVYALTAAEIDGVPLQPALQRASDEAHRRRRVRAEEAARRMPVLMLFPLVFCILPAFCLLTVVPLLAGSVADLGLPT